MISHKAKLFSLLFGLCVSFSGVAKGEIVSDCDLIKQAKLEGAKNPQLVLAIAKVESSKNSRVLGKQDPHSTHYGLMQLKLGTARMMGFKGKPKDLLNWKLNLKYGSRYLNEKLEIYQSKHSAAAAYNAGKAYICKKGRTCTKGKFTNQSYVDRVMRKYKASNPNCLG